MEPNQESKNGSPTERQNVETNKNHKREAKMATHTREIAGGSQFSAYEFWDKMRHQRFRAA